MLLDIPFQQFAYPTVAPISSNQTTGRKIFIATFGSLGDLHPYLALGAALRGRGHQVTVGTLGSYREKISAMGLGFCAIRPDIADFGTDPDMIKKAMDLRTGTQFLLRTMILPHLEAGYHDLLAGTQDTDFLISHPATFAAPIVATQRKILWAASSLAPLTMSSAFDPPLIASALWLRYFQAMGPTANRLLMKLFFQQTKSWIEPIVALRKKAGVTGLGHPFLDGQFSPYLNLALFSPRFGPPQPDWPEHTIATGFLFMHSSTASVPLDPELEAFLAAGDAPIVFTLGSTAVMAPDDFFSQAAGACRSLGLRAVLLAGPHGNNSANSSTNVYVCQYAPHAAIFKRAAAIVHQCGVGTTAEALRAGKPMLAVPFSHDQPDNAHRLEKLGVGFMLPRGKFTTRRAAKYLRKLLADSAIAARAAKLGGEIQREDGVNTACDAIEKVL